MDKRLALLALPVVGLSLAAPATAQAHEGSHTYSIDLEPLNSSGAHGTAMLSLKGHELTVRINSSGLVPGAPHAQHIHGMSDGEHDFTCPTDADDKNGDGVVSTAEGLPKYGDINISLTTSGDTSNNSGLAVDRFPKADSHGNLSYTRTITVSDAVAEHIADLHVVQHGIDKNGNGTYDFSAGKSELDSKLPQEATAPADCGTIKGSTMGAVPTGGVETGGGTGSGPAAVPMFLLGGVALTGAAGATVVARRRRATGAA